MPVIEGSAAAMGSLIHDGIAGIPGLRPHQVEDIQAYLDTKPCYGGHVERNRRPVCPQDTACCWSLADVVGAPHLFELGLQWIPLAQEYLQAEPRLYSMNVFETFPSMQPMNPDIQEYHRDKDDVRFLALFVFLTSVVKDDDGAHYFQAGTHRGQREGSVITMRGLAGAAFLEDGRGLHLGLRPMQRPRRIAWIRYGVSDPPASYLWDHMRPTPKAVLGDRYPRDPERQRIVHLVVA